MAKNIRKFMGGLFRFKLKLVRFKLRVVLWTMLGLIGVLLAVVLALTFLMPVEEIRDKTIDFLASRLGRRVIVEGFDFTIWHGLELQGVSILEPETGTVQDTFVSIDALRISYSLRSLLKRQLEVKSFEVERPTIRVVMDAQGKMNFDDLIALVATPTPGPEEEAKLEGLAQLIELPPLRVDVSRVTVSDLTVLYQDPALDALLKGISIKLEALSTHDQGRLRLKAYFLATGSEQLDISFKQGAETVGAFETERLELVVNASPGEKTTELRVELMARGLIRAAQAAEIPIDLEGKLAAAADLPRGKVELRDAKLMLYGKQLLALRGSLEGFGRRQEIELETVSR